MSLAFLFLGTTLGILLLHVVCCFTLCVTGTAGGWEASLRGFLGPTLARTEPWFCSTLLLTTPPAACPWFMVNISSNFFISNLSSSFSLLASISFLCLAKLFCCSSIWAIMLLWNSICCFIMAARLPRGRLPFIVSEAFKLLWAASSSALWRCLIISSFFFFAKRHSMSLMLMSFTRVLKRSWRELWSPEPKLEEGRLLVEVEPNLKWV